MQTRGYADANTDDDSDGIRTKNNLSPPMVGNIKILKAALGNKDACALSGAMHSFPK